MQTRKISLWLLAALVLAATATRLYQIDSQSIWFDEGWSAFAAVQPSLQTAVESDPTNPPLYYILLNLSVNFTGDSPLALRLFSLVLGVLTIPLTYRLARRLFDERAGLYAAFLAAFSPLLWWASQEARMYTLLAVVVLLTTMGWHQLLREPKRWAWLVLWAGELALLYAHNTGPVIVIWLNLETTLLAHLGCLANRCRCAVVALVRRSFPSDTSGQQCRQHATGVEPDAARFDVAGTVGRQLAHGGAGTARRRVFSGGIRSRGATDTLAAK
jgi:predicted membrane-bound mannosyltransferase